ncbi:uncharacterized protein EI90DRAFT_3016858 [Cantharellus anzutake]|uniref:uncharacterized protein n=1 Tax=Cantharellus anzutake TaxID=1750568 RepID=UPI001903780D|nr:uncharacterized protein EI90DRAFT_3016858 [Cantharellus anzutake]KAF8330441.1 hypothetical protein EI90DRAFT_3016858 [Cantharellus anzutake]
MAKARCVWGELQCNRFTLVSRVGAEWRRLVLKGMGPIIRLAEAVTEVDIIQAEITAAKAKGYGEGIADRAEGKLDSVTGAIKGDKQQQASGNAQQDKGIVQQNLNK